MNIRIEFNKHTMHVGLNWYTDTYEGPDRWVCIELMPFPGIKITFERGGFECEWIPLPSNDLPVNKFGVDEDYTPWDIVKREPDE